MTKQITSFLNLSFLVSITSSIFIKRKIIYLIKHANKQNKSRHTFFVTMVYNIICIKNAKYSSYFMKKKLNALYIKRNQN